MARGLAEANELRTALLAGVSHDLRTPLASIKAAATSLLQHDVVWTPEAVQEWLRASSRYLGGFTPEEALKAGRLDRVRADLDGLAAGVYL